jgi:F-box/WD-40 domain protein MET30
MVHSCYRHQETSQKQLKNEEILLENVQLSLTKNLSRAPPKERENIQKFWKLYNKIPSSFRYLALDGLLHQSCFPQLSYLSESLQLLTKVNFLEILPKEISFKILQYMDPTTLCRASQTCQKWKTICDSDELWKRMCTQHINKKCTKCGWGLPLMSHHFDCIPVERTNSQPPKKRLKSSSCISFKPLDPLPASPEIVTLPRPWKHIFAERSGVAKNWKKLKYDEKDLIGHTDVVKCLYYDESKGLLISASNDCTLRAWNTATGVCIGILKGHTKSVRGVQFDNSKIISCSMDKTIKIWNRKTFECVRTMDSAL